MYDKMGEKMDSRAYTEAYYIIGEMSEGIRNKIPSKILNNIEEKMDKNYNFSIEDEDFENAELLEDTEKILAVLYTDYLASDEERMIIKNKERILENRKQEKVSDIEIRAIFPKTQKEVKVEEDINTKSLVKVKWYTRIINFFKRAKNYFSF